MVQFRMCKLHNSTFRGTIKRFTDHSSVNQVEFNPYLYQRDLLEFCCSCRIQLEAYSPLTKKLKLNEPELVLIARKYYKSTAQILIRWVLQRGLVAIPKSSREENIRDNTDVFDFAISPEDMRSLDSLSEGLRIGWDPSAVE